MDNESAAVASNDAPVSIEVSLSPTVNYATQQNDVPVIHSVRVTNKTDSPLQNLYIAVDTEPSFSDHWETRITSIDPGDSYNLGKIDLRLSHDFLFQLNERVVGTVNVVVSAEDGTAYIQSQQISVLAYDEWSGLVGIPEILAAFVMPNHPAVEQILADASTILGQQTGDSSLSGYQSRDRKRVAVTVAAIYAALQRSGIRYINPPASFEESGQKIRTPDRIIENKLGTCLDLAVLMAACLEQAGLHPLICLLAGHAFAGVWLDQECFPDSATDDVLRLRKRVELGEMCVVETTMITAEPAVPFEQAIKEGNKHLEDSSTFRCTIDIARARKSRIRPLPIRSARGSIAEPQTSGVDTAGTDIPLDTSFIPTGTPDLESGSPDEDTASRLDRWKRKLLDLTLRNRLLNFRETKKTLPVLCPNLSALEDALAEGDSFRLYQRPTDLDESQPRDAEVYRRRTGDDAHDALLAEEIAAHRLRADVGETELSRRLVEIYREARTSLEENGANTLYLALGFLAWHESSSSTQRRVAPIILVPLEIERRSVQEGFSINQGDDEPMVNITLLELLQQDFQLSVPGMDPIPRDAHGIDVPGILTAFRKAVKMIDRWEVIEDACIGHFSFTKFLMWRDLEVRTDDLKRNKVVSHLINTPHERFDPDGAFPDSDRLDDTHKPDDVFCPVEADSSQLAAVCAAVQGKSFVLHGPPGTGKSQTITNLVSHALAKGKSVLFVSEKMAALRVVHRRLVQCGLGPFCLELHSNKSHKREVVDQLSQALDSYSASTADQWVRDANRLAGLRKELNGYVRALHQIRDTGESLFHGVSKLIGLRAISAIALGWPPDRIVDHSALDRLLDTANQLQVAAMACTHPATSVWAPVAHEEWSPGWRNGLESALDQVEDCIEELKESAAAVAPLLGMDAAGWCERDLRALSSISKALLEASTIPSAMMTSPDWTTTSNAISEWIARGSRRDELRKQLYVRYTSKLIELDLDVLSKRLAEADAAWFLPRAIGRRQVKQAIRRVLQPEQQVDANAMSQDLETARALRDEENVLQRADSQARQILGSFWSDGEADWQHLAQMRDTVTQLRKLATQAAGTDVDKAARMRQQWSTLLAEAEEQLGPDGPTGQLLQAYVQKVLAFATARTALESTLVLDTTAAWGDTSAPDHLGVISSHISNWRQHLDELRTWCHWRAVRRQATELGLMALIAGYEQNAVTATEIAISFERSFYEWWVNRVIDAEPTLRSFFSREFERKIDQFREVDKRYTDLTRDEIRARLAAQLPRGGQAANHNSEMGILQREIQKQRRHMPIRQLFQKIPNLLPRLKPCLLMSPISVAQYLDPAHPPFDLVVFDEASQIPVWDAVGAIARGSEAIIVGDPKQLPPTSFFARADDSEAIEEDIVEDMESILDDCLAAQLPEMHLKWHYRSRHESLIAFSNYHYYDNRLLTFPSPSQEKAVYLVPVRGTYDKSKSRTNRAEAEAVVAEVLRRLKDPHTSRSSIGIVTFSISQQGLVEDLLDDARRANPEIEPFFDSKSAPNNEPVFVKNLENVQGDERDAILFSICYGPDGQGRVSMNFGPLNRDGGERRLNVAITRARREVLVFSTLKAEQIDLSRTRARGVADLKSFLDYADRGPVALAEQRVTDPSAECESPFEQQVCEALRSRGYTVHSQVGCSGYRIDLAVVDPDKLGRYLLGIECDGANYHRAKTARDRDRLRELILRDLGWRLHRVWSTDWWEKPDEELARIEAAIENTKTAPVPSADGEKVASAPVQMAMPIEPARDEQVTQPPISSAMQDLQYYEPFKVSKMLGDISLFYEPSADSVVRRLIEEVVSKEGPVSLDVVARRVAAHWGIAKVGSNVAKRISGARLMANVAQTTSYERAFLWPANVTPGHFRIFRVPGTDSASRRSAEELPPEEVANAALHVLEGQISMPIEDLVTETARLFGFARTGQNVARFITMGVDTMVQRGFATEQDGMVTLPK